MQQNESATNRKELLSLIRSFDALQKHFNGDYEYICELPHLGPLLVSVKRNNKTTLVLVRSVLGWLTYSYIEGVVGSDSIARSILISLYRYFSDVIDGWNVSFKSKKSTFYDFFNIFGFGSSNKIKSNDSLNSATTDLNKYIKTKVLCDIDRFLLPKFINRFAQITCFHVKEIENFTFPDVLCVNMTHDEFEYLFPNIPIQEIKLAPYQSRFIASFMINEEEINNFKLKKKSYKGTIKTAIKEFLITEAEYFILIDDVFNSEVLLKRDKKELSEITLNEFFGDFIKIHKSESSFVKDLFNNIKIVKKGEIRFNDDTKLSRSSNFLSLLPEHEHIEYTELKLLELFLDSLIKHSENWIYYVNLFLSYDLILNKIKTCDEESKKINLMKISGAFDHILQRLTRYPSMIRNVLEKCPEEFEIYTKLSKFYLQLIKFLRHSEKLREQEDSYRRLHKIDNMLKICVAAENQQFIDQLDCHDENGNGYTLFLLSNQMILTRRKGDPLPIMKSNAEYTKIQVLQNINIELYKRGQVGFYLISRESINDAHFTEFYENCSLSARYFISNDEDLRNRFIRNFHNTIAFFSYGNLLFVNSGGDFTSKVIKDDNLITKDMMIYQVVQSKLIQRNLKTMDPVLSYIFSHPDKKIVCFSNDDMFIKVGKLVFHVIDFQNLDDVFCNLYNILKTINQQYLKIEEKISLYFYLKTQSDKPFATRNENVDFTSLINFFTDEKMFEFIQIYCDNMVLDHSFQKSSQIIEPQVFLRSKFIMQEILELNSDKKLMEFEDTDFSSILFNYEPKLVEDLIIKILEENEDYMSLFKKIFKSHDDVHRTILNYLSNNVYCYFTNDDLHIIKIFIKQREHLNAVPIVSSKSFYKILLKYFELVAYNNRLYLVSMFLTRIFNDSDLTEEEINYVIQKNYSLD